MTENEFSLTHDETIGWKYGSDRKAKPCQQMIFRKR